MVLEEAARTYLQRVLALDPAHDAETIVALRRQHLGSLMPADPPLDRARGFSILEQVRAKIWDADDELFHRARTQRDLQAFADLRLELGRLERVRALKPDLDRAAADRMMPARFMTAFKTIVVASPAVRSDLRSRITSSLSDPLVRMDAQAGAYVLEKRFQNLRALESEWLDTILWYRTSLEGAPRVGRLSKLIHALFSSGLDFLKFLNQFPAWIKIALFCFVVRVFAACVERIFHS